MKIIELRSENVKKVKAIEIKPKGNMVVISGKNGAGKTSVLDSIWFALEGKASLKGTPMPIRKGEKQAEVTLTLDDFIVTRKWTDNNKSYLKVTNKEGLSYNSPQELLDNFIGKLTFDPLEFAGMRHLDQRNLLLQVADIDIDYWDSGIVELKERRRLKGQEVKLLEGQREVINPEIVPKELVSTGELNEELKKALYENQQLRATTEGLEECIQELHEHESEVKRLKVVIEARQDYISKHKRINITEIEEEVLGAEESNEIFRANERNKEADKKLKITKETYGDFTKKIEEIVKEKENALSKAKMPIIGLGINDTGVTYNDIPFGQLSSSEQLRVSLAIAMALNPKLKVIRITDGSLLDDDSMEIIKKLAEKKDYQVWLEKVSGSGELGFYIEDGEIESINGEKAVDAEFVEGGVK